MRFPLRTAAALASMLSSAVAQQHPSLPLVDRGACPGEYCGYREWTARKSAIVYDTWEAKRRRIGEIAPGQKVNARTGLVVTVRPGRIRMDRDLPEKKLTRGDTILTYAYRGEGFSAVWVQGRYESEYDISFAKWPDGTGCGGPRCAATYVDLGEKIWWAQVEFSSGKTGWIDMTNSDFEIYKVN
jgi:hypothetical protein